MPILKCSILTIFSCTSTNLEKERSYQIIPAVNAYSFSDLLTAKDYRSIQNGCPCGSGICR